ncbi:AmmeMemoRadiSam system radical SAM enzyme [Candidatus Woesearchaeota archaeon]|nr:AmmeMemoRadiSam system radical SAM enzyme [Candidatus Woesearchaeota archaeon]
MKEAMFYEKKEKDIVQCTLCPHSCIIKPDNVGVCGVRRNKEGILYSLVYDNIETVHIDPIEKKPLYHFLPGTKSLSLCTVGCNFRCEFCQNSTISQVTKDKGYNIAGEKVKPEEIVELAQKRNCDSISYTYTEPTIFYELAYDTARVAHGKGIKNVFVTNGYINAEPLKKMQPYLDAANIDLKSFSDDFYGKVCGAKLKPVLDSIKVYYELGIWIEITTLVVPGQNDSEKELGQIAQFIAGIDKNIPWHVSRFHPDYKMYESSATPVATIHKAVELGKNAGLNYIYVGNVWGDEHDNTYCPNCHKLLIRRHGFSILHNNIKGAKCRHCNHTIPGIFSKNI